MEKSKGYDNIISYIIVVSVSALFSKCYNLAVKIIDDGLYFILFYFSIFRTTQVRVYQSCYHISHKLMV